MLCQLFIIIVLLIIQKFGDLFKNSEFKRYRYQSNIELVRCETILNLYHLNLINEF